eukprot:6543743-Prorocentrum_lima.AAC.1
MGDNHHKNGVPWVNVTTKLGAVNHSVGVTTKKRVTVAKNGQSPIPWVTTTTTTGVPWVTKTVTATRKMVTVSP